MQSQLDTVQRFVFDRLDARGCIVQLQKTCESIQATHYYPDSLARLLNQFSVAVVLLRDSIKLNGSITIQLRTQGAISLMMADCMTNNQVRAICEYDVEAFSATQHIAFNQFGSDAVLAITITPDNGERYQAIVPIEHAELSDCLEDYFSRSEQLPTWFKLIADAEKATGIALHALPAQRELDAQDRKENFENLRVLLDTLTAEEALTLSSEQILTRLYHEQYCRLFEAKTVKFGCVCSVEKSLEALKSLGQQDVIQLIAEQKDQGFEELRVDCHFCFQRYQFVFDDILNLFE